MTGPYTATPHDFSSGEILTDGTLDAHVRDFANAFGPGTSYIPTWTASTTNPTLNNGTLVGRYWQVQKTVWFQVLLTIGSTTSIGSGAYSLSLPVQAAASGLPWLLAGQFFDSSTGIYYRGEGRIDSGGAVIARGTFVDGSTGPNGWSSAVPVALASSDTVAFNGMYEAA